MLGMLARVDTTQAPDGQNLFTVTSPTTVRVSGKADGIVDVDFDERSGLPIRVRYQTELRFPRSRPLTAEERKAGVPKPEPLQPTEAALLFEERTDVGGILFPMRIREVARGTTFRDTRFASVEVNPPLSIKDFAR